MEGHWSRLAAEMDSLSLAWRDRAASTFERDYWSQIRGLVLASLPDIREDITEIQRLAVEAGADLD